MDLFVFLTPYVVVGSIVVTIYKFVAPRYKKQEQVNDITKEILTVKQSNNLIMKRNLNEHGDMLW